MGISTDKKNLGKREAYYQANRERLCKQSLEAYYRRKRKQVMGKSLSLFEEEEENSLHLIKNEGKTHKRYKIKKDEMNPESWEKDYKKFGKMNRVLEKAGFKNANESWSDKHCDIVL